MTVLVTLVFILLAWVAPMLLIANMEKIDKNEKLVWLASVLPFSWFAVVALLISSPQATNNSPQGYRHL